MGTTTRGREPEGAVATQEGREGGEPVPYALAHKMKIEILISLNESPKSTTDLARELHQPLSNVSYHVAALRKLRAIEEAGGSRDGNLVKTVYRAVQQSRYSAEEIAEMSVEEERIITGMGLQNAVAEHFAAYDAGTMRGNDPTMSLLWRWFNVDGEGRSEIATELDQCWDRLCEIEARSSARRVHTKEDAQSIVVSLVGHPRVRPGRQWSSLVSSLVDKSAKAADR